jgi:hypothetical protein
LQSTNYSRVLCLHAAAKRLQMSERTLRYQASRGRIQGAFKQGKLWKFSLTAIEDAQRTGLVGQLVNLQPGPGRRNRPAAGT